MDEVTLFDHHTWKSTAALEVELELAIDAEDYETCATIKKELDRRKKVLATPLSDLYEIGTVSITSARITSKE